MSKWNADIIRDTELNRYRAIITFDDRPEVDTEGSGWRELCANVRRLAGISFPLRKYLQWGKLSDYEQIAGIDACHTRKSCVVTTKDRKSGWMRFVTW